MSRIRYEHAHPGELILTDVKEFVRSPTAGWMSGHDRALRRCEVREALPRRIGVAVRVTHELGDHLRDVGSGSVVV